jgi:putative ABC transport system ATP-binding protein
MTLLSGRNLRKTYRISRTNTLEALRGVDVEIDSGEIVAIMGPSGSGKSTLMHILGLLHAPDSDQGPTPELRVNGADVTRLSDNDRTRIRARSMGFVFQSFNLVPTLTAFENVMLAAGYASRAGAAGRRSAHEALSWVELTERANHRPMELSGGEQQRVALARALVNEPPLLLADEPPPGTSIQRRSIEVLDLLRRLNEERGQTMLLVTHDPEVAVRTDRVILVRDGLIDENQSAWRAA